MTNRKFSNQIEKLLNQETRKARHPYLELINEQRRRQDILRDEADHGFVLTDNDSVTKKRSLQELSNGKNRDLLDDIMQLPEFQIQDFITGNQEVDTEHKNAPPDRATDSDHNKSLLKSAPSRPRNQLNSLNDDSRPSALNAKKVKPSPVDPEKFLRGTLAPIQLNKRSILDFDRKKMFLAICLFVLLSLVFLFTFISLSR